MWLWLVQNSHTNSILTDDNANRAGQGNVTMQVTRPLKHCQRHNKPSILTQYYWVFNFNFLFNWNCILFSCRDNSSYKLNILGPLCLWQSFYISHIVYEHFCADFCQTQERDERKKRHFDIWYFARPTLCQEKHANHRHHCQRQTNSGNKYIYILLPKVISLAFNICLHYTPSPDYTAAAAAAK